MPLVRPKECGLVRAALLGAIVLVLGQGLCPVHEREIHEVYVYSLPDR